MYLLTFLWVSLLILGLLIFLQSSGFENVLVIRTDALLNLDTWVGRYWIFSSADRVVLAQVPGSKLFLVFRHLPTRMYSLCLCVNHVWRLSNSDNFLSSL